MRIDVGRCFLICLLTLALSFSACDPDFLPLEVDLPELPPHPNLSAFYMGTSDTMFLLANVKYDVYRFHDHVTPGNNPDTSFNFTLSIDHQLVGVSQVHLVFPEWYRFPVFTRPFFTHHITLDRSLFRTGALLELKATHPDFGLMTTRQVVPERVPLESVKFVGVVGFNRTERMPGDDDSYDPFEYGLEITLDDPPGRNYYEIRLDGVGWGGAVMVIDDPRIQAVSFNHDGYASALYLSDSHFDGEQITFLLILSFRPTEHERVEWRCLSPEWHGLRVDQVKSLQRESLEPEFLFIGSAREGYQGNVEGGEGLFGVGYQDFFDIEF